MKSKSISIEHLIEIVSALGKKIRTTRQYWNHITTKKHSELEGKLDETLEALREPDEVYRQDETSDIYLYYRRRNGEWISVVARHLNGDGFIVTAYLTTKSKRKGIRVWQRKNNQ